MRAVTVRLPGLSLQSPTGTPSRTTDPPESPALLFSKGPPATNRESPEGRGTRALPPSTFRRPAKRQRQRVDA